MLKSNSRWLGMSFRIGAILLALVFTAIVILVSNANPIDVFSNILNGAFGSVDNIANVFVSWVPLLLASSGLLLTFAAGLWNIGIEGQITLGAIFTTFVLRSFQDTSVSPAIILILGILAGMIGGALWASLAGALKIYGGVSEIFGGLGLNFIATAITLWLIFGPWKRPGIASMSRTPAVSRCIVDACNRRAALECLDACDRGSWYYPVYVLLNGTYFGLRLKAVGKNMRSAFILGIPTNRYMMLSFLICGGFAGLAGALQVEAVYHRLIPSISSGYGFLGLLVAMLVNYQAMWVAPVALFFAILNIGSIQLPIVLKLDSLGGVLQEALVLIVLMIEGVRRRFVKKE